MEYRQEAVLIKDLPEQERPRERMVQVGKEQLSNAELIAILLRTGRTGESVMQLAQRLLHCTNGLKGLTQAEIQELVKIPGIGTAKAIQVLAGVELGRRISRALPEERPAIRHPRDAAQLVMDELRYLQQEHFVCLFLNTKFQVVDKQCIFKGSLNASVVHPREVFKAAIHRSSAGIICVHNHPSGDPTPSREDLEVTERLVEAGHVLGIELVDHLIIGDQTYYSMKEKGLILDR